MHARTQRTTCGVGDTNYSCFLITYIGLPLWLTHLSCHHPLICVWERVYVRVCVRYEYKSMCRKIERVCACVCVWSTCMTELVSVFKPRGRTRTRVHLTLASLDFAQA